MNPALACLACVPAFAQAAAPAPAAHPWTILVYGGADNNADGPILEFLDDVRKAIDDVLSRPEHQWFEKAKPRPMPTAAAAVLHPPAARAAGD